MDEHTPMDSGFVGEIQIYSVDDRGRIFDRSPWTPNRIVAGLGFAIAKCLGMKDMRYSANMAYLEFENTLNPISAPTVGRMDGREYFTGLASPKDYLRVPLIGLPSLSVESQEDDYSGLYGLNEGNVITFHATTLGSEGVNGVPFSNASNSVVYGISVVSAPDVNDPSQDIILNRGYFPQPSHRLKQASGQIGASWALRLLPPA